MRAVSAKPIRDWATVPLQNVCEVHDYRRIPINSADRLRRTSGKAQSQLFPYYGATGLVDLIDDYIFDGEYVLIGEDGAPFLEPDKDVAYIARGKFWVNNHAHILKSHIDARFLCHFLNQIDYREYVSGTTRLKLTQAMLRSIAVDVPPLKEQRRIVAKIEELFSELDKGVESLKTAREQLKVYRHAVLKDAFEGKLTARRNTGHPRVGVSHGWRSVRLATLIGKLRYGTSRKCDYKTKGTGVLRIPNIGHGVLDTTDLKFAALSRAELDVLALQRGDILAIRSNGSLSLVGKCAMVRPSDENLVFAGYLMRIRPRRDEVEPEFLLHALASPGVRRQIESKAKSTSGVNNINARELGDLMIPICERADQIEVVNVLSAALSAIDSLEREIDVQMEMSASLRQSILRDAFSGKLVPQDPNDEPASVLLGRIAAKDSLHTIRRRRPRIDPMAVEPDELMAAIEHGRP